MNNNLHAKKQNNRHARFLSKADEVMRRLLDITLSVTGMILLAPLFLFISIAVKRSSSGPVFYWGKRVGKNGRVFKILKFRTMYERQESYSGPKVTAENDPRITPLGRILRQTKINELPQLWNVLIGDMSLVGPRPEDPDIANEWPEAVRNEIFSVRPGVTSPASVVYRNEEDLLQSSSLMDTYLWDILPSKIRLDQIYVRNRSFLTDLDVIFWTVVALIPRLKTFTVPEYMLYWGPFARFTHHYLGWFFVDFLISFGAVATAGIIRRITTPLDLGIEVAVVISLAIALLFSTINALAGLNRITWSQARPLEAASLAFSTTIVTILVLVGNFVFFSRVGRFPISIILFSGILSYFGFVIVRYRSRLLTGLARYWVRMRGQAMTPLGERVLIVGAGEVARFAVWLLTNENLAQAFTMVGMVDDNPRKIGRKVDGYRVISNTDAIPEVVKKYDIGLILFAIADIDPADQERILSVCQTTPARIIPIPDVIDTIRAQFPRDDEEHEVHFNKVLRNATTDSLTGVYNRHHFMHLAQSEFNRSQRYGHPMSLIAIRVDYTRPKKSNYSKSVGSLVLQAAASRSQENIRAIDLLGRFEDDLLILLLPETGEEAAQLVSKRLKERILKDPVNTYRGLIQPLIEVSLVNNRQKEFAHFEEMLHFLLAPVRSLPVKEERAVAAHPSQK